MIRTQSTFQPPSPRPGHEAWAKEFHVGRLYNKIDRAYKDWTFIQEDRKNEQRWNERTLSERPASWWPRWLAFKAEIKSL